MIHRFLQKISSRVLQQPVAGRIHKVTVAATMPENTTREKYTKIFVDDKQHKKQSAVRRSNKTMKSNHSH